MDAVSRWDNLEPLLSDNSLGSLNSMKRKTEKESKRLAFQCKFVDIVQVVDPDSGDTTEIEIWKDPESNALLGVEAGFMDGVSEYVYSPYNIDHTLNLPAEDVFKFRVLDETSPVRITEDCVSLYLGEGKDGKDNKEEDDQEGAGSGL